MLAAEEVLRYANALIDFVDFANASAPYLYLIPEKLGKATVDFDAGEGAMATMHIVAGATMPAKSA
jgi:hypothetical protein